MTKPRNNPQTVGRKQWDGKNDELIIKKLEEAFAYDCTDNEACLYAGVSTQALYKYQKKNPAFVERKQALKRTAVLLARQTVVKAIATDPNLALRYLERKCPKEFSTRTINAHTKEITEFDNLTDEELVKIARVSDTAISYNYYQEEALH